MKRIFLLLALVVVLIPAFIGAAFAMPGMEKQDAPTTLLPNTNNYVWWYLEAPARRAADGGMEVTYTLHLPGNAVADSAPEAFFSATTWRREGRQLVFEPDAPVFTKPLEYDNGCYRLTMYAGGYQRFKLWAKVLINGKTYYAQTFFNLFGDSQNTDATAVRVDAEPAWPQLALKNGDRLIWVQTEMELAMQPQNLSGGRVKSMEVYDQHGALLAQAENRAGEFYYTPPFDKELAGGGSRGRNHIVFAAQLPDGGAATYYLPVSRSTRGKQSLKGGLAVVCGAAVICFVPIWRVRKRFEFK